MLFLGFTVVSTVETDANPVETLNETLNVQRRAEGGEGRMTLEFEDDPELEDDDLYDRDPDDPDDRGEEEEAWDDEQFAGPSRSEIVATRVLRRMGVRFWDDRAIDAFGDLVRRLDEQRSDLLALRLPGESRLLLPNRSDDIPF